MVVAICKFVKKCRNSYNLPVAVLFLALAVDSATLSFLLPALPKMLTAYYCTGGHTRNNTELDDVSNYSSTDIDWNKFDNLTCDDVTISRHVGIIAGIGPIAEFLVNPFIGYVIGSLGANVIFNLGAAGQLAGVLTLIFVQQEWGLLLGRIAQSIGSTMSVIAGSTLLATVVPESARIRAFGIAYSGYTVGSIIGYPLGSLLYDILGRHLPFVVILVLSGTDTLLRFLIPGRSGSPTDERVEKTSLRILLCDPYVQLTNILTFFSYNVGAVVMATLPLHLSRSAATWQIGVLYCVATVCEVIAQFVASNAVGTHKYRVLVIISSFVFHTSGLIIVVYCTNIWLFNVPLSLIRVGEGLFSAMIASLIAHISDTRSLNCYHVQYAMYVASYSLGCGLGPVASGYLVPLVGFRSLCFIISGTTLVSVLMSVTFLNVPTKIDDSKEKIKLISAT